MEKLNFVKNGILRLPPGFRFHPTEEELVVQYLKRKVFACPLPASIIPEVDVCKSDPWDLPGNLEQERYFFSTKEAKYPNGNRSNRATGTGYWKATGLDKKILASETNRIVGMKKTLVFYRGKSPHGSRTDWVMHEYRLVNAETMENPAATNPVVPMENWVLCRIFLKRRGSKNGDEDIVQTHTLKSSTRRVYYDFMAKNMTDLNVTPSSSSSGSSGITEESANGKSNDHEESSSCHNTLSIFRRTP